MTLTQTVLIEERYLQFQDLRAMDYCERRWQAEGRPAKRWGMFNFLERMLQELQQNGIGYPKILLRRKKEIQRREFTLEPLEEKDKSREPQIQPGDACPDCKGRGFLVLPGGNIDLCRSCVGKGRKTPG